MRLAQFVATSLSFRNASRRAADRADALRHPSYQGGNDKRPAFRGMARADSSSAQVREATTSNGGRRPRVRGRNVGGGAARRPARRQTGQGRCAGGAGRGRGGEKGEVRWGPCHL